jgi:5-methylcytosine-specific restriction enzyme A
MPFPRGPNGRGFCRQCGVEVPKGRKTFCGDACVETWKMKRWPAVRRAKVFERDKGICAECGIDCTAEKERIRSLRGTEQHQVELARWRVGDRYNLWEHDHIVERIDGGTNDLSNLQTLCLICHRRKSAANATRRAMARRTADVERRPLFQDAKPSDPA